MAGQVLRMNVNGRLTTPPRIEAVLVTNSVCSDLLQGSFVRPEARGLILEQSSLGTSQRLRFLRGYPQAGGRARVACSLRKFDPVSAAQFPSASREAATIN
ncbi:hypothetical protein AciX8_3929 [Granulicella mallensis MP5ACTX8]|uniref:Uncharacterized protein n=1 Tax=Granulicella mallensis (strain ATCC BAA-1857 / DSM 23137 / MP5ACTX8) TaxID=682795 RepID=G8P266_GRAMM|nr:hypothetical protein AciX8_3929 [Granulicella mallensis MP5ACTX8]